jgi:hypothetical protein
MVSRRFLPIALALASFLLAALPVLASGIELSYIRAIRVSDTTITISFLTDAPTIGSVQYTTGDDTRMTLTDSEPQIDHLFTIDELDPKHGYSFTLTASQGGVESNTYMVLLAPETIGPPGQSILPSTRVLTPQGALVASTLSASTTPAPMSASVEPLLLLAIVAVAACVIVGTRLLGRIRQ